MPPLEQKIAHLRKMRAKHRKHIRTLEEQIANYGMTPPLSLLNELEHEQEQLRQVKEQLAGLEAQAGTEEMPGKPVHPPRTPKPRRQVNWEKVGAIVGVIGMLIVLGAWLLPNAVDFLRDRLWHPTSTATSTSTPSPTPNDRPIPICRWDESHEKYGDKERIPVPADYDGDGKADLSIKDPDGIWWIDYAKDGFGAYNKPYGGYGNEECIPVPADYDGDGKADLSVKCADGVWRIYYASSN